MARQCASLALLQHFHEKCRSVYVFSRTLFFLQEEFSPSLCSPDLEGPTKWSSSLMQEHGSGSSQPSLRPPLWGTPIIPIITRACQTAQLSLLPLLLTHLFCNLSSNKMNELLLMERLCRVCTQFQRVTLEELDSPFPSHPSKVLQRLLLSHPTS